ncbi:MAG: hypothetical protein ABIC68_07080 [Candidatus Omnitrophota bacterium]
MEIVDFSEKEFNEIPKQDNPAFGKDECLMIVKQFKSSRFVVLHIKPDPIESVNRIAIVWKKEIADIICNALNIG